MFRQVSKKGLYVLLDHVPKHYGASATVNSPKMGPKGANSRTLITFSDDHIFDVFFFSFRFKHVNLLFLSIFELMNENYK